MYERKDIPSMNPEMYRRTDTPPPCPTCPAPAQSEGLTQWSSFGPCKDGRYHDTTCVVARREMAAATWPCGRRKYPDVVAPSEDGV